MKIYSKIGINITFVNGKAKEVKGFLEKHPKLTYGQIFLRGIEGFLIDEGLSVEMIKKAKDLVK